MNKSKSIIAQELGKLGGQKTARLYGKKHFKRMAQKRWLAQKAPVDKSS